MAERIGIFGGSFNPIHIGHLVIAEAAWQEFGLSQVIFVPSGDTPGKDMHHIDKGHRYRMVETAIAGNNHFSISPIERDREGPSYTVDTIHLFQKRMGKDTEFYFICGTDAVVDLPTWKYNRELLACCHFICASRPGNEYHVENAIGYFGALGREKIHFLKTPELAISSTILRDWIARGKSVRYFIPDAVRAYMKKYGLYKNLTANRQ